MPSAPVAILDFVGALHTAPNTFRGTFVGTVHEPEQEEATQQSGDVRRFSSRWTMPAPGLGVVHQVDTLTTLRLRRMRLL